MFQIKHSLSLCRTAIYKGQPNKKNKTIKTKKERARLVILKAKTTSSEIMFIKILKILFNEKFKK